MVLGPGFLFCSVFFFITALDCSAAMEVSFYLAFYCSCFPFAAALCLSFVLFCSFQNYSLIFLGQEATQEAEAEDGTVEIGQEVEVALTTVTRVVGKVL